MVPRDPALALVVVFEHREIDDPAELEDAVLDQAHVGPDLGAGQAGLLAPGPAALSVEMAADMLHAAFTESIAAVGT